MSDFPSHDADEIVREAAKSAGLRSDRGKTRFLKALIESNGKVDKACELSGVGQGQLYRWWNKDNRFRRAVETIRKFLLFLLEIDTVGEAFGSGKGAERLRALELRAYNPARYADGIRDAEDAKELPYQARVLELIDALKRKGIDDLKLINLDDDERRKTTSSDS